MPSIGRVAIGHSLPHSGVGLVSTGVVCWLLWWPIGGVVLRAHPGSVWWAWVGGVGVLGIVDAWPGLL